MRGFICDQCKTFTPDRVMPTAVLRYAPRDADGKPREQEAHFCDACSHDVAALYGLEVPASDVEPIDFEGGVDD